ncbi:hypothetical protein PMKS-001399 [Pichia membranifaciens]|uniref:Cation efflux protein transmembrane domain-containing protein n=1 Tax=Pichia membranifaciens TaxID=4926 RepID=A0A1Q2YEL6_9ASCO|nr:hypothetical protein PMKS-001399 [Pichia membranifaciens]
MMGPADEHKGHTHTHASDEETLKLYDPKNLADEGVKITWIGFGVNCGMAVTKFIGGFYFHSQALIADAIHAVGDLISDVLTLSTVRFTHKKADALYPFGYGKIETFGSVTRKVGERLNSKVLIANAWHHRVDSLTSVVAVATISTGYFLNIYWLDSIGGLIVAMLIMKVGVSGVVQSFKELIDKALPVGDSRYTKIEDSINVILMKKDSHVLIRELSILPSGTNLNLVLKLGVSPFDRDYENKLTLEQMGSIGEYLKNELAREFHNIKHVSVQFVSNGTKPEEEDAEKEASETTADFESKESNTADKK